MPDFFRDQPRVRWAIGGCITALVWVMYLLRVSLGIGPMQDDAGRQAPSAHYLAGAVVITGMVVVWIVARALMTRNEKRN